MELKVRRKYLTHSLIIMIALAVLGLGTALTPAYAQSLAEALGDLSTGCPSKRTVPWPPPNVKFEVVNYDGNKRALVFDGAIHSGDSVLLRNAYNQNAPVDEIWFNSNGGNAAEGPVIGEVLRDLRVPVRVPNGYICISSCTIAFLGGIIRRIDDGGLYGVHTFYNASLLDELERIGQEDYSKFLSQEERAASPVKNKRLYREVQRKKAVFREDALRTFIHSTQQQDALLAANWALFMQKMGIGRELLTKVILVQKSQVYASDDEVKYEAAAIRQRIYNYLLEQLKDKLQVEAYIQSHDDDIKAAMYKALSDKYRDYICPPRADLVKYNVINVR